MPDTIQPDVANEVAVAHRTPDAPAFVAKKIAKFEHAFSDMLAEIELPENLRAAITYTALAPGKRLRPIVTMMSCQAAGGSQERALAPAAALELIHNFSLVHDDLPAMDDDDVRRGRPTLHIQAGEAMAVLAGDAMLSIAFELIARECPSQLSDRAARRITAELASSTTAMISGQVYDTLGGFPREATDAQRLELIHRNKTGALIRAACRMGAFAADADDQVIDALTTYGEHVGLMFQIVDDQLDVTQSSDHLGKATGKDIDAGKLTWPGVFGLEQSHAAVDRLLRQALETLETLPDPERCGPLRELAEFLAVRTR